MSGTVGFRRAALHLGGLWALAFAQPLFDLLGRNAQFFVARGSTTRRHPAARVRLRARAAAGGRRGRLGARADPAGARLGGACSCSSRCWWPALLLPPLGDAARRVLGRDPGRAAAGRRRRRAVRARRRRAHVRHRALARAAGRRVPLPRRLAGARAAVPGRAERRRGGAAARSATPIVQIVLDELPRDARSPAPTAGSTPSCSPTSPGSRANRPGTATRRRSTTSRPRRCRRSSPASSRSRARCRPSRDHPRSLFTLFERSHELTVIEPITDLCPERACATRRAGVADRLRSLGNDLEVVAAAPAAARGPARRAAGDRQRLGGVRDRLGDGRRRAARRASSSSAACSRGSRATTRRPGSSARARRSTEPRLAPAAGVRPLDAAARRVALPARRPPLSDRGQGVPGLDSKGWFGPQWQVDQAFQRHVLQVQYTDRLVGALLDKLRARGLFDEAVIVVTADHGVALMSGEPRRPANRGEHRRDRAGAVLRQAAGPARGPRRRRRGADDRRAADDREGGRRRAAVEGRRDPGRRARGRSGRADRRLARGRAGRDGAARHRAGEAARARAGRGAAAARRRLRGRPAAGADRPARRVARRRAACDDRSRVIGAAVVRVGRARTG